MKKIAVLLVVLALMSGCATEPDFNTAKWAVDSAITVGTLGIVRGTDQLVKMGNIITGNNKANAMDCVGDQGGADIVEFLFSPAGQEMIAYEDGGHRPGLFKGLTATNMIEWPCSTGYQNTWTGKGEVFMLWQRATWMLLLRYAMYVDGDIRDTAQLREIAKGALDAYGGKLSDCGFDIEKCREWLSGENPDYSLLAAVKNFETWWWEKAVTPGLCGVDRYLLESEGWSGVRRRVTGRGPGGRYVPRDTNPYVISWLRAHWRVAHLRDAIRFIPIRYADLTREQRIHILQLRKIFEFLTCGRKLDGTIYLIDYKLQDECRYMYGQLYRSLRDTSNQIANDFGTGWSDVPLPAPYDNLAKFPTRDERQLIDRRIISFDTVTGRRKKERDIYWALREGA